MNSVDTKIMWVSIVGILLVLFLFVLYPFYNQLPKNDQQILLFNLLIGLGTAMLIAVIFYSKQQSDFRNKNVQDQQIKKLKICDSLNDYLVGLSSMYVRYVNNPGLPVRVTELEIKDEYSKSIRDLINFNISEFPRDLSNHILAMCFNTGRLPLTDLDPDLGVEFQQIRADPNLQAFSTQIEEIIEEVRAWRVEISTLR